MANSDQARLIAQRIAQRVEGGAPPPRQDLATELSAVRSTLNELQHRLTSIESKLEHSSAPSVHSPWIHPSQERFGVEEATVSQLVDYFQGEKACSMEPGKACDHCAMCSSRGF